MLSPPSTPGRRHRNLPSGQTAKPQRSTESGIRLRSGFVLPNGEAIAPAAKTTPMHRILKRFAAAKQKKNVTQKLWNARVQSVIDTENNSLDGRNQRKDRRDRLQEERQIDSPAKEMEVRMFSHVEIPQTNRPAQHPPLSIPKPMSRFDERDKALGPSYAIRDPDTDQIIGDVRDRLAYNDQDKRLEVEFDDLWNLILAFSVRYFGYDVSDDLKTKYLLQLGTTLSPEFVQFAGSIAVGGPCGTAGWEELFLDPSLRTVLLAGVLWKVFKEHVFASLLFGGSKAELNELQKMEVDQKDDDGFARTYRRGEFLQNELGPCRSNNEEEPVYADPDNFDSAVNSITAELYTLLKPFMTPRVVKSRQQGIILHLHDLVARAGRLSVILRLDPGTVYFFADVLKDEHYNAEDLEIFSASHEAWMEDADNHPQWTSYDPAKGLDDEKLQEVKSYSSLVRIACFDRLDAFRKGGWRPRDREKGFRTRTLAKGRVACRWGLQRNHAGEDMDTGFLELSECVHELGTGMPWWLFPCKDPAHAVYGVPIPGLKSKHCQADLTEGPAPAQERSGSFVDWIPTFLW